jgi:Ni/Co efflux regulator RcnB
MTLWRRIVLLLVAASVMAFMSAPTAWAGDYGDHQDKDNCYSCDHDKDHDKDRHKDDHDKEHH